MGAWGCAHLGAISIETGPGGRLLPDSQHRALAAASPPGPLFLFLADPPRSRQPRWAPGATQSPALHFPRLPWPYSPGQQPGPPRLLYFRECSSLAKQIQLRRKATPCKIALDPQRRFFLVFSLTFSTGLKPRMCLLLSALVPPHCPPHS